MPIFESMCREDVDRMESSGDASVLFWSASVGSHLIDIVEAAYIYRY